MKATSSSVFLQKNQIIWHQLERILYLFIVVLIFEGKEKTSAIIKKRKTAKQNLGLQ